MHGIRIEESFVETVKDYKIWINDWYSIKVYPIPNENGIMLLRVTINDECNPRRIFDEILTFKGTETKGVEISLSYVGTCLNIDASITVKYDSEIKGFTIIVEY